MDKNINKAILEILNQIHPEKDYESSEDYISDELLDSYDVIELIAGIENRFDVKIDGMDIIPENFSNIEQIVKMIEKSRQ